MAARMVMDFIRRILNFSTAPYSETMDDSLHQMSLANAINRRRATRIKYPELGPVGKLPGISVDGKSIKVSDVSLGGVCLSDVDNNLGEQAGIALELTLQWPDFERKQKAVIVGVNLHHRHIQFVNLDPEIFVRLSQLLRPGYLGTQFHRVQQNPKSGLTLEAPELWIGPTGESIIFYTESNASSTSAVAEIRLFRTSIQIFKEQAAVYKDAGKHHHAGQKVNLPFLQDALVCLANIKFPTERVQQLLGLLQGEVDQQSEDG